MSYHRYCSLFHVIILLPLCLISKGNINAGATNQQNDAAISTLNKFYKRIIPGIYNSLNKTGRSKVYFAKKNVKNFTKYIFFVDSIRFCSLDTHGFIFSAKEFIAIYARTILRPNSPVCLTKVFSHHCLNCREFVANFQFNAMGNKFGVQILGYASGRPFLYFDQFHIFDIFCTSTTLLRPLYFDLCTLTFLSNLEFLLVEKYGSK